MTKLRQTVYGSIEEKTANQLAWWLFSIASAVLLLVFVGGMTRLTDSGLSITEWDPIMGIIPPLSEHAWQELFEKYRVTPEFLRVNSFMSVEEFETIFWWEWIHRFIARLVAFLFFIPFIYFVMRGLMPRRMIWPLVVISLLGISQGVIGWWMVYSGLSDRVDVSHYRLAVHLLAACTLMSALIYVGWGLLAQRRDEDVKTKGGCFPWLVLVVVVVQLYFGALVAGLRAGMSYNTWPLMDGAIIPPGLFHLSPWWINVFENNLTVQFIHRCVAYVLIGLVIWQYWRTRVDGRIGIRAETVVLALCSVQVLLGILTLLYVVPISLALAHQVCGVLVLAAQVVVVRGLSLRSVQLREEPASA